MSDDDDSEYNSDAVSENSAHSETEAGKDTPLLPSKMGTKKRKDRGEGKSEKSKASRCGYSVGALVEMTKKRMKSNKT